MTRETLPTPFGILAEFSQPADLVRAARETRDAGYRHWDAHTPFPIPDLNDTTVDASSGLATFVFLSALAGVLVALIAQWWFGAVAYPQVYAGRPSFLWITALPVAFEVGILFAALGAFVYALHLMRLPRFHHPLFESKRFDRVTDDGYFILIDARDPRFDEAATPAFFERIGAIAIERMAR